MTTTETIEVGDYVKYSAPFHDGIAMGLEIGAGYVIDLKSDMAHIRNGDRYVVVMLKDCVMHAKQTRLEI